MNWNNPEWESSVEKEKLREPPSGLNPAAMAMASRMVDLPLPFSPVKMVTGLCSENAPHSRTAGMLKGYCRCASGDGGTKRTDWM